MKIKNKKNVMNFKYAYKPLMRINYKLLEKLSK